MDPDQPTPTRDQYIDMLIASALQDAEEMAIGFDAWCKEHAPQWHEMGRDETWIRLRVDSARSTYRLHQTMQSHGYTPAQCRQELRRIYSNPPDMYAHMLERTGRHEPNEPILGTHDLMQRSALRVIVYAADRDAHTAYCRWADAADDPFIEDEAYRFIRDMSTVEELDMALVLCQHVRRCCEVRPKMSAKAIEESTEERGKELRAYFIITYGYPPEKSTAPRILVTIDGPMDRDEYWALYCA